MGENKPTIWWFCYCHPYLLDVCKQTLPNKAFPTFSAAYRCSQECGQVGDLVGHPHLGVDQLVEFITSVLDVDGVKSCPLTLLDEKIIILLIGTCNKGESSFFF